MGFGLAARGSRPVVSAGLWRRRNGILSVIVDKGYKSRIGGIIDG